MKTGRNDPCPCGSGRKFKQCCGSAASEPPESLAWRRLRRLLDDNNDRLRRFVLEAYGRGSLFSAWREFTGEQSDFDPDSPHIPLFFSWFYGFWSPDPHDEDWQVADSSLIDVPPLRAYLDRQGVRLDPLLREYLECCLLAPLSFHAVLEVEPGRGMLVEDLVTGARHQVTERLASQGIEPGDLLFGQVVQAGGVGLFECCGAVVIPPIERILVAEDIKRLVGRRKRATFPLRNFDWVMLEIYHALAGRLLDPPMPQLSNTDGDPFSLRKVVFDIPSAAQAFAALRHLDPGTDEDLEQGVVRDGQGRVVEARLHWVERSRSRPTGEGGTVLAVLAITGTRLVADVNSESREDLLRTVVEGALGTSARYRATEIQTVEQAARDVRSRKEAADSPDEAILQSPEVQALMQQHLARHYEAWVSEKIPALGNRTPLSAVKTRAGREAVEALVTQLERDGARMRPPLDPAIVKRLRERLGLGSPKRSEET